MTVLITTAKNDRDLIPVFGDRAIPCPIPFGDFIFEGVWTEGKKVKVCGDRKKFPDLVQCIGDNRHLEQVRAAREVGFDFVYVVLEGTWKSVDGEAYSRGRSLRISSNRILSYLQQLRYYAGVQVFETKTKQETVDTVLSLETMFQTPPEDHSSLLGFHELPEPVVGLGQRPGILRRLVKELPGIGWELSARVETKAIELGAEPIDVMQWTKKEWEEVEGIGRGLSSQITEALGWHSQ